MSAKTGPRVKKVSATRFRSAFKTYARQARKDHLVLIENRQQGSKYLVDQKWLDDVVRQQEVVQATLEVLSDRELTDRLLRLGKTLDEDVRTAKLLSLKDVFGEA